MITTKNVLKNGFSTLRQAQCIASTKVFIILFYFALGTISGVNGQNLSIQSYVVESESGAPIPYASVYTLKNRRGTITDQNGAMKMHNLEASDTLIFYFTGFEKKYLSVLEIGDTVKLDPLEQLLDEVMVLADASVLYRLVSNTRKNAPRKKETAQTYLELSTFFNTHQLEYFQGYYNGTYDGYDINGFELKTARFGIQATENMAFLTQETSEALYKHEIYNENDYFPDSPFGLNRRKLVKKYQLELNNKYLEQNGDVTYVISFHPKTDTASAFSGKVWIDSASNLLTKVDFIIENAAKFPFQALHKGGELDSVNMRITRTYDRVANGIRLASVDFDYDFIFDPKAYYNPTTQIVSKTKIDSTVEYVSLPTYNIRSEAVLAAYNYKKAFFIPRFTFAYPELSDYKKLMAFGDHPEFWKCYKTFRVGRSDANEQFLSQDNTITHRSLYQENKISDKGIYEYPYRDWSPKRIYFRKPLDSSTLENANPFSSGTINARKYFLEAQILFEADSLCDSLTFRTKTIFDPFTSFYHFERTPRSVAFLNVYFDLMEIYRRQLVEKLNAVPPSIESWTLIYEKHKEEVALKMQTFFKEVERGTNEENFLKWNALVLNELGINNNALFHSED